MFQTLKATYLNSTFVLQTAGDLPEGAEVELSIQLPQIVSLPDDTEIYS